MLNMLKMGHRGGIRHRGSKKQFLSLIYLFLPKNFLFTAQCFCQYIFTAQWSHLGYSRPKYFSSKNFFLFFSISYDFGTYPLPSEIYLSVSPAGTDFFQGSLCRKVERFGQSNIRICQLSVRKFVWTTFKHFVVAALKLSKE